MVESIEGSSKKQDKTSKQTSDHQKNQSGRWKRSLHESRGEPRGERGVIRLRNPTEDERAFRRMLTNADPSILVPRARRFLDTWSGNERLWKQPLPEVRKFLTSGCACAEVTNITAHAHNDFCPSPLHWGKLVGYKLSRVALGTRMRSIRPGETTTGRIRLSRLCS